MGWEMIDHGLSTGKPAIYNFNKNSVQESEQKYTLVTRDGTPNSDPLYFTWASQRLWEQYEYCIKYTNDTGQPMIIPKLSIKICACDSDKKTYFSSSSDNPVGPCEGWGATYYSKIRVSNDNQKTFAVSTVNEGGEMTIPKLTGSNMNYAGSSKTDTAIFGEYPYGYGELDKLGLIPREFTISDCPIIEPGGIAYIHIGIKEFEDGANKDGAIPAQIKFVLNPTEMEITMDQETGPYIWRFASGAWHLVRPIYVYTSSGWQNIEELTK